LTLKPIDNFIVQIVQSSILDGLGDLGGISEPVG
jgi:hypothetical protein